jgi:hypothetical protein
MATNISGGGGGGGDRSQILGRGAKRSRRAPSTDDDGARDHLPGPPGDDGAEAKAVGGGGGGVGSSKTRRLEITPTVSVTGPFAATSGEEHATFASTDGPTDDEEEEAEEEAEQGADEKKEVGDGDGGGGSSSSSSSSNGGNGGALLISPDGYFAELMAAPISERLRYEGEMAAVDFLSLRDKVAAAKRDASGRLKFVIDTREDDDGHDVVTAKRIMRRAVGSYIQCAPPFLKRRGQARMSRTLARMDFSFVDAAATDIGAWSDGCVYAAYVLCFGDDGCGIERPNAVRLYDDDVESEVEVDTSDEEEEAGEAEDADEQTAGDGAQDQTEEARQGEKRKEMVGGGQRSSPAGGGGGDS